MLRVVHENVTFYTAGSLLFCLLLFLVILPAENEIEMQ